jgi:hypothetical protein
VLRLRVADTRTGWAKSDGREDSLAVPLDEDSSGSSRCDGKDLLRASPMQPRAATSIEKAIAADTGQARSAELRNNLN